MKKAEIKNYLLNLHDEVQKALDSAEEVYNQNKRSTRNRNVYYWAAAQEYLLSDILNELNWEDI